MKLPNVHYAHIPNAKIAEYLLSPTHPDGKSKYDFFVQFGFHPNAGEKLAEALKQHALKHEVKNQEQTLFGVRYTVEGFLECPDGRTADVRAIWFIDQGEAIPRLVTAYPAR